MDWVKIGFGNDLLDYHPTKPFIVDYSAARISDIPIDELTTQAIRRIVDKFPKPYTLICSGGVDSQAMILAWLRSGVEFTVVAGRYNGGMNDHDLENLWLLQKREGFEVQVLDLDILAFHENELLTWAERYQCTSPHILTHMYICSQIPNGTVISSGNYVLKHGVLGGNTFMTFGLHRYASLSEQSVVPHFWMHDQDLMPAFEVERRKLNLTDKLEDWDYAFKCELFRLSGYDVIPQAVKYNGFEKIKEYYDDLPLSYRIRVKWSRMSIRYYDIMFRNMLEGVVSQYSSETLTIFDF